MSEDGQKFGKAKRIRKTDEYSSVFAFRMVIRGNRFKLHYRPNQLGGARLGVTVPKKFARAAVVRNRIKRVARECFRSLHPELKAYDMVLRLAAPLAEVDRASVRHEVAGLMRQLAA